MQLDKIDISILKKIERISGAQLSEVVALMKDLRSERSLRERINALDAQGYISLDRKRERGKVFATISERGTAALTGRDRCPTKEAEQHER